MPVIKYRKIFKEAFERPVFGVEDLSIRGVPRNYAKKRLHELSRMGELTRIERGKYTLQDDPLVIGANLTRPSYISLWSAMSIRGQTSQIPFAVEVVTSRKRFRRRVEFKETQIVFYTVKPEMMYGYEQIVWKDGLRINVAKSEKIVIDALYLKAIPLEELEEVMNVVDRELLISYARLTRDSHITALIKRLMIC